MSEKIYVSIKQFPLTQEHIRFLKDCAVSGERKFELVFTSPDEMKQEDLDSAVGTIAFFPPQMLTRAKRLEWVQLTSAGADAFTKPGILKDACVLTNGSGAYSLSVGEHMIAQTFALIRNLEENAADQSRQLWGPLRTVISIEGSTILVLGLGDIGSSYARKMKALGAYVIGVTRHAHEKPDAVDELVTIDQLEQVLPRADIITMILPSSEETKHIMNDHTFSLMKQGVYLINDGRGSAIDQEALMRALDSGRVRAAALDVMEPEPLPSDHPLWKYTNVLITPHSAGWWQLPETLNRVVRICGKNLSAFSQGTEFTNVVNRELGY